MIRFLSVKQQLHFDVKTSNAYTEVVQNTEKIRKHDSRFS